MRRGACDFQDQGNSLPGCWVELATTQVSRQLRSSAVGSTPTQFASRMGLSRDLKKQKERLEALEGDMTFPIRTIPSLRDYTEQNPFCSIFLLRSLAPLGAPRDL